MNISTPITTVNKYSRASLYLDLLRGLSALEVMLFHERLFIFRGYGDSLHGHPLFTLFLMLTSRGHQFVMVFFVLSGYLVGSSVLKSIQDNRWSWRIYLINRFSRLWLVLIPALILAYGWATLQAHVFGSAIYSVGGFDWTTFFGNVFFLQQIVVTNFADNSALWSLSYEFWYYIMFPCLMLVVFDKNVFRKVLYMLILVILYKWFNWPITDYFAVWLLGVVVALLPSIKINSRRIRLGLVVTSGLIAIASLLIDKFLNPNDQDQVLQADLVVGIGFAILIYAITRFLNEPQSKPRRFNVSTTLAGCSYTLYLVHYPVLNMVGAWMGNKGYHPSAQSFVLYAAIAIGILLYAWLIARFTETRTDDVKRFMYRVTQPSLRHKHASLPGN